MKQIPKKTGTFNSFDGTPIYYEVRGEGRPIVLSYGIVCLINHWHNQIKYFSQKYQVIAFDLRGHHNSGVPQDRSRLSIDAIAQDIKGLVDHLEIKQASFWGHSFGSQFLIRAYDMYPEIFHDMVLINGFASNPLNGMLGTNNINQVFNTVKQIYQFVPETSGYLWEKLANNPLTMRALAISGGFNLNLTSFKDVEVLKTW
jgi:pimeloyl-ACP methyl ester carboxylesterase